MAAPRAARRVPFLPRAEENEEIDPALLDTLPEVAEQAPPPFPLADADDPYQPAPDAMEVAVDVAPDATFAPSDTRPSDLALLLDALHADAQDALAQQHARISAEIDARTREMSERLAEAIALVEELRHENARLTRQLDHYERAFSTLRDLAADVDAER